MHMYIDEPRQDGHARGVDHLGAVGNVELVTTADGNDAVAVDQNDRTRQRWSLVPIDQQATDDGERRALRLRILLAVERLRHRNGGHNELPEHASNYQPKTDTALSGHHAPPPPKH